MALVCPLPDTPASGGVSLDPVGSVLTFASVGGSLFTLSAAQEQEAATSLWMAVGSALLLLLLALWLRCAARPLVPRPVLASWPIRCGVLSACGLYFGVSLARYLTPLYLQLGMGWSQADTGLAMLCQPLTLLLGGLGSGRLAARLSARAQTALSLLLLAAAILLLGAGLGSFWPMGASMVLLAAGQSLFQPANAGFVLAFAAQDQLSVVGALLGMARGIALPLGIVCCNALLSALSPPHAASLDEKNASSTAATAAIDAGAARTTVWLYLLPTAAALAVTLMRGKPPEAISVARRTSTESSGPVRVRS